MRSGCLLLLLSALAFSQGIITTVAGTPFVFPNTPIAATAAPIGPVSAIVVDSANNLYIADPGNNLVFKVDTQGVLTVVAGNGIAGYSGDGGPALQASLSNPRGLAVDRSGNLLIADAGNFRIRMVTLAGVITTIAGNGTGNPSPSIGSTDGKSATDVAISPTGPLAFDALGDLLFTDRGGEWLRSINRAGILNTLAGNGSCYSQCDGHPAAELANVIFGGINVDTAGNIFFSVYLQSGSVGQISADGTFHTLAGGLYQPQGLAVDFAGNVFVAQWQSYYVNNPQTNRVVKITPAGVVSTIAGTGIPSFSGDGGPASQSQLGPSALAFDASGALLIADTFNVRVRRIQPDNTIATIVGNGGYFSTGDGAAAASASMNNPQGVAVDAFGNLFIADTGNNRIRKVTPDGIINALAGNGTPGFTGDGGPAGAATFNRPLRVLVNPAGNVLVADSQNGRIRQVDSSGTIASIAGGTASSSVGYPMGLGLNPAGGFLVADSGGERILNVDSTGKITTIAGAGLVQVCPVNPFLNGCYYAGGFGGDGGPALKAYLYGPSGVAADPAGDIFISDQTNGRLRKVAPDGTITSIGPSPSVIFSDPHTPPPAYNQVPADVVADSVGNVYFSELVYRDLLDRRGISQVERISPSGAVTLIAGGAPSGFSGDGGPAVNAALNNPGGLALDSAGNLYIADSGNNRIRKVLAAKPPIQVSTPNLSFSAQSTGAPAPTQTFNIESIPGLAYSLNVTTATGGNWLTATPQSGAAPRLIEVVADPSQVTTPGVYQGTITIAARDADPGTITVGVTFTVTSATQPTLALDTQSFSFSFARTTPAQSQGVTVSNAGGGTLPFTANVSIASPAGSNWLTLSAGSGTATPATPVLLTLTADPTGLAPGTYTATLTVAGGGTSIAVPVTMTISALDQAILLSQRGLAFTAVANGGIVPPQTFAVRNIGAGIVKWTATPSTLPAGLSWLQVSPASGSSDAAATAPAVTISVNAAGLAPGAYYGLVTVSAPPPVVNSPQVLTVFLQVLSAGSDAGAIITPGALTFTAVPGPQSPSSQTISVYNITASPKSYRSTVSSDTGLGLSILPTDATLDPQRPNRIVIQPFTSGLAPGVYNGTVTLLFSDGRLSRVNVRVVVANSGSATPSIAARKGVARDPSGCTPTKLVPSLISLPDLFAVSAGWPVSLGARVSDDCGVPLQSGSVTVSFSNGDPPVVLQALQDGRWEGTWPTRSSTAQVTLRLHAESPQSQFTGDQQISGSLQTQQQPPVLDLGGVISVFGSPAFSSPAPGGLVVIYGQRLAGSSLAATDLPWQTQLEDTQVSVQGIRMRLYYVTQTQINGMIPSQVNPNAPQQLVVQRGNTLSLPSLLNIAPAQPVILSAPGTVTVYPADGSPSHLLTADAPAHAGDTLNLSCVGLGSVSPAIPDGTVPDPSTTAIVSGPLQVQIGGIAATVTLQALGTQFPGIYQVNAVVSDGVSTGDAVPVVLSIAGQDSPAITISVR
jgi:uncharacterized protein (TIGR03437 family)